MRVLHVGKFYPPFAGGMEHFLADLLATQQALGIQGAALVHHHRPGWRSDLPYAGRPGPWVYRAPCLGRMLYVPLSPSFPWWLDKVIRDFAPDLLHLHLPNTSAFAALLLPRARRLPWVVHWHADVVTSALDRRLALAYGLYRPFEQGLLNRGRAIIVTSPPYLEASPALAPWRERCAVIPLGLDPLRLPQPDAASQDWAQRQWGPTGLRVLTIGRLTYYKGQAVLIRAAASLPDVRVLIVGQGEHRQRLLNLITSLDLADRVSLTGLATEDEVAALLASCDLFCLPSLERTEAFGLVLLEAMRYGKPVVVSDIPGSGAPWVVQEAGIGRLFPPGDAQALAKNIALLQADPQARRRLGEAGVQALHRHFGIGPVASAILDLYEALTNKSLSI
jgi:rhamnosyl/mannosyltransferase